MWTYTNVVILHEKKNSLAKCACLSIGLSSVQWRFASCLEKRKEKSHGCAWARDHDNKEKKKLLRWRSHGRYIMLCFVRYYTVDECWMWLNSVQKRLLFFWFEITLLKSTTSWWKRYCTRGRSSDVLSKRNVSLRITEWWGTKLISWNRAVVQTSSECDKRPLFQHQCFSIEKISKKKCLYK